jgi:spermidine/putrescine transport system permease protein
MPAWWPHNERSAMNRRAIRILWFLVALAIPATLILAPLASFLRYSFYRVDNNQLVAQLNLDNYREFFGNPIYGSVFLKTLLLCGEVTAIGLGIGYPVAYFIWRQGTRLCYLLLLLSVLPLFMSYIIKLYTMRRILGLNGLLNDVLIWSGILQHPSLVFLYNQRAILITMAVVFLPFAILPIFLSLERIPKTLIYASSDLGGAPGQTFRHVVLPLSLPGTIAGGLFTFVLALGDFVTPQMVGGPTGFTFGRIIWSQFGMAYDWPFGAALGVVLLVVALVSIFAANKVAALQRV